jgi:carbamoyl-phosphate synthase large subunit
MSAGHAAPAPRRVLLLGSGALQIGQAGEFDYSGSQALKALREEGTYTALINPNIATTQTTEALADAIYFLPVTAHFVEQVIIREKIDSLLLGFGGQTALNVGLELEASGALARHGVSVLGTPVSTIRVTEDRSLFMEALRQIGVNTARGAACSNVEEAIEAARKIGFPVILRGAFSLGGKGSAIVRTADGIGPAVRHMLAGVKQVLVEECLSGWKEIEYEVVRDGGDNCITVCNMENVDPMGIHTGDSIVVAPSQTLNDFEYQLLRDTAIRTIRHLGVVGECNIQYALDPVSGDYRVIEVNARLSRSSALASKATGYPLAYVATRVALGHLLPDIANSVTRTTSAFFEPALDYIVCKVPRWDFDKFPGVHDLIGPEMKSVGEVMAIGRSFPEVMQKALRMLDIGADGLDTDAFEFEDLRAELEMPTPRRMFALARAFREGMSVEEAQGLTGIDRYFLEEICAAVGLGQRICEWGQAGLTREHLLEAKLAGYSDAGIGARVHMPTEAVRQLRHRLGVRPHLAQIDTLAAEFPSATNYLYMTYAAHAHDAPATAARKVLVLGSGCYRIGSSVEFDWCCVNAAQAARELGYETLLLNCNPETVSTDYDTCDRLVFDEISLETILEIVDAEGPQGVIVSMGGQTPNSLALTLGRAGVRILGTAARSIDAAEDRKKFSDLCDRLEIDQPRWAEATAIPDLGPVVDRLGGFPVLVRPSYVLSGAAMRVAHTEPELKAFLENATDVSPEHPVVISKFETRAREIEFDGVAAKGEIVLWAISEHVEDAGVHSGDATLIIPPQRLYLETIRRVRSIAARLAEELQVTGPFNLQLLSRNNDVKVIECNLRASRSFPFVSKALGQNFITEAVRLMLGAPRTTARYRNPVDLDYVVVKAPMFSFRRLSGADTVLGVEMASTGEVGCFGDDGDEAFLKAMIASGFTIPTRGVLLSLGPVAAKYRFVDDARILKALGLRLYATPGTAEVLNAEDLGCQALAKNDQDRSNPQAIDVMRAGHIDLVINIPREWDEKGRPDGFRIRRAAVDLEIPLLTDQWLARRVIQALTKYTMQTLRVAPWSDYLSRNDALSGTAVAVRA